jgi:hypothetical protein
MSLSLFSKAFCIALSLVERSDFVNGRSDFIEFMGKRSGAWVTKAYAPMQITIIIRNFFMRHPFFN